MARPCSLHIPDSQADAECWTNHSIRLLVCPVISSAAWIHSALVVANIISMFLTRCQRVIDRGVARNSFWVGIIFLLHETTVLYTTSLTTSAAVSAQNNF